LELLDDIKEKEEKEENEGEEH